MTNNEDADVFELMPNEVIEIKDRILNEVEMEETSKIVMALMSALIEVIVRTGPSKSSALETVAGISISMAESIKACDAARMCNWNDSVQ